MLISLEEFIVEDKLVAFMKEFAAKVSEEWPLCTGCIVLEMVLDSIWKL